MILRQLLIASVSVISLQSFALDQAALDKGIELYNQRSYVDAAKVPNALAAAKQFETVLPSAANDLEKATVKAWIAQSYFSYADALHALVPENVKDKTLPTPLSKAQQKEKIDVFNTAFENGFEALKFLGVNAPKGKRGVIPGGLTPYDWKTFGTKLTAANRAIASQALYFSAAAYSQYNSLRKERGDETSSYELASLFYEMLGMSEGLQYVDGAYYHYSHNRMTGRLLDRVAHSTLAYFISNEKLHSAYDRLADCVTQSAIDANADVLVAKFAFNSIYLADYLYFQGEAEDKQTAKALLAALVQAKDKLDPAYQPENEIALIRAENRLKNW